MPTSLATKTARTVFASATITAGTPQRARLDLQTAFGGGLTIKMTNGATGPTVQLTCNVLASHNATMPAAAAAGADWKTLASFGGGVTANAVTENYIDIPAWVMSLEVEFTGNTVQNVTAEAMFSELTSIAS